MDEKPDKPLLRNTRDTYTGSFSTDLLEQYKLYVQSAENVSARRVASSRYLLTVNTALLALYGLLIANANQSYLALPIPLTGILVSLAWYLIIKSHANLNGVKFRVIHEIEQHLPAALYDYEWQLAEQGKGRVYRAVTGIEEYIPLLFTAFHVGLAVLIVLVSFGVLDWPQ